MCMGIMCQELTNIMIMVVQGGWNMAATQKVKHRAKTYQETGYISGDGQKINSIKSRERVKRTLLEHW